MGSNVSSKIILVCFLCISCIVITKILLADCARPGKSGSILLKTYIFIETIQLEDISCK